MNRCEYCGKLTENERFCCWQHYLRWLRMNKLEGKVRKERVMKEISSSGTMKQMKVIKPMKPLREM
ncbi:hypothetical protein J7K25_00955 [bacterium]|nr:hypothetical protein [bacterium]